MNPDIELNLYHIRETEDDTIGIIQIADRHIWVCEDAYKDNLKGVSRIPADRYLVQLEKSQTCRSIGLDVAYTVVGVPGGRTQVRIHPGYDEHDTEACLLFGFGVDWKEGAVLESRKACKWFYEYMDKTHGLNPFWLNIKDCWR